MSNKQKEVIDKQQLIKEAYDKFMMFGSTEQMSLCQRFFPKKSNKNLDGSIFIFMTIILLNTDKISRQELEEFEVDKCDFNYGYKFDEDIFEENKIKKSVLTDSLKILRCNKLIVLEKFTTKIKQGYRLNTAIFYKDVRYRLTNVDILSKVAPLMLNYIKTDARLTADDYFKKLDKLILYILLLPKLHNEYQALEENIYNSKELEVKLEITIKDKSKSIRITPVSVEIDNGMKVLHYRLGNSEDIRSIKFGNIDNIFSPTMEKIDTLFSVNNILYENFKNIEYFKDMQIITNKKEMESLAKEYKISLEKLYLNFNSTKKTVDFFLVKARDKKEEIVSVLLQRMGYIKVLHPQSVQKSIQENIKIFEKNSTKFLPEPQ